MQRINMDARGASSTVKGDDDPATLLAELHALKHDLEYFPTFYELFVVHHLTTYMRPMTPRGPMTSSGNAGTPTR